MDNDKPKKVRKDWNVWVESSPRYSVDIFRAILKKACGESSGSGSGVNGSDVSYHQKTKDEAEKIGKKAASLRCVNRVHLYHSANVKGGTYLKGKRDEVPSSEPVKEEAEEVEEEA